MLSILLLLTIASPSLQLDPLKLKDKYPDAGLNTSQMVGRHGYPVELHANIQTPDGYLLDIYRIPCGKNNSDQTNKPVVFLMHGLLCSSVDWIVMGPEKALGYILADAGYDVWMGNARGNTWSRKHIKYNADKDADFWSFSWHEIGSIDLPTMIDYVLSVTGQEKLFYVGHSQGTTSFFVMGSERPEYNSKIRLMVALAPVAYMSHMTNPFFRIISNFHTSVGWTLKFLGVNEFLPNNELMEMVGLAACNDQSRVQIVCSSTLFMVCGWNSNHLNESMLPVILSNVPAGASTRQILHYGQEIKSGKFRQYDYGVLANLIMYRSMFPPDYKIEDITAPLGLFYANNDWLAAIVDVKQLASKLPNLALDYFVPDTAFNHLDFLYSVNSKEVVYDRVVSLMSGF